MSDEHPAIPIPGLPGETIPRLLRNLDYGRAIDPDAWALPHLVFLPDDRPNVALARRLMTAFHRAMDDGGSAGDGLWKDMGDQFHGPFFNALRDQDADAVAEILAGVFHAPAAAGICRREQDAKAFAGDWMTRLMTADVVVSLGTALGVLRAVNPFAADAPNALGQDLDAVMSALCSRFGGSFAPPQIGGIFGLEFRGEFYPHKYLYQVYVACRLAELSTGARFSCLEIGGGMGFLAYAAHRLDAVSDFCLIDLPLVNVLQGYLLLNSSFAARTVLYGEPDLESERRIRILPDVAMTELPEKSFDIAINQDSLPEMHPDTMSAYLEELQRTTRTYLLSINHESGQITPSGFRHGVVREAAEMQSGYATVYRMPYWLRPGYVEELFRLS
jgi:hypothetical protein